MTDLYQKLAAQAVELNCNAVIIQDRTDIATGAQHASSAKSCTTLTGHAGMLVDEVE